MQLQYRYICTRYLRNAENLHYQNGVLIGRGKIKILLMKVERA